VNPALSDSIAVRRLEPSQIPNDIVTEDSAALSFRDKHQGRLLYCHDEGTWFVWTGFHWKRERTGLAFEWARQHIRDLTCEHSSQARLKSNKTSFAAGVEKFSRTERAFAAVSVGR
jgi:putative DNA primase/helicase